MVNKKLLTDEQVDAVASAVADMFIVAMFHLVDRFVNPMARLQGTLDKEYLQDRFSFLLEEMNKDLT